MRALGLTAFAVLGACHATQAERASVSEAGAAQGSPATAGIACAADEQLIFACQFADGKRVSVCGAGEWSGRYRFGGAAVELELNGGRYAYTMYSGGGEGQIAFDNGETRHIVFSRMVRTGFGDDGNKPAVSDGIVTTRRGEFQSIRACADPDVQPIRNAGANAIWEDEGELFTEETIRADPFGNE